MRGPMAPTTKRPSGRRAWRWRGVFRALEKCLPGRIRTPDLRIRSAPLCPSELRADAGAAQHNANHAAGQRACSARQWHAPARRLIRTDGTPRPSHGLFTRTPTSGAGRGMNESQSRVETFFRSTPFSTQNRKERYYLPAFLSFCRRVVFRAFRGAASRTVLPRRRARRESGNRFVALTRGRAVSRSAYSPAAFSVPFLAGQKGDIPMDPTGTMAA